MSYTNLGGQQVLKTVFDAATQALRVTSTSGGQLVTEQFDYIGASYPTPTQEIYVYKLGGAGGTTVATVTVDYVDATKDNVLSVTKV